MDFKVNFFSDLEQLLWINWLCNAHNSTLVCGLCLRVCVCVCERERCYPDLNYIKHLSDILEILGSRKRNVFLSFVETEYPILQFKPPILN